jgi:hypothetical protein
MTVVVILFTTNQGKKQRHSCHCPFRIKPRKKKDDDIVAIIFFFSNSENKKTMAVVIVFFAINQGKKKTIQ